MRMAIGAAAEAVSVDCLGLSGRRQGAQPSEQPAVYSDWRRRGSGNCRLLRPFGSLPADPT